MLKIIYKGTYEGGKDIYCNKAKTKLSIVKTIVGLYELWFNNETLGTFGYSEYAKKAAEGILKLGIGRNYAEER